MVQLSLEFGHLGGEIELMKRNQQVHELGEKYMGPVVDPRPQDYLYCSCNS